MGSMSWVRCMDCGNGIWGEHVRGMLEAQDVFGTWNLYRAGGGHGGFAEGPREGIRSWSRVIRKVRGCDRSRIAWPTGLSENREKLRGVTDQPIRDLRRRALEVFPAEGAFPHYCDPPTRF